MIPSDHLQRNAHPLTIDTLKAEIATLRDHGHIGCDTYQALLQMLEDAKRNEWR